MGSEFYRQPSKRLDREFRQMGATRAARSSQNVTYRFPDGARRIVPTNISPGNARAMLMEVQARYGDGRDRSNSDPLRSAVARPDIPAVSADRMVLTRHAHERVDLMAEQANLSPVEIRDAIRFPDRVLWSPMHESWMWVRGRVIVVVVFNELGDPVIRTLLWATEELWERNPRPEPEPA